jgi:hypothetical protein
VSDFEMCSFHCWLVWLAMHAWVAGIRSMKRRASASSTLTRKVPPAPTQRCSQRSSHIS